MVLKKTLTAIELRTIIKELREKLIGAKLINIYNKGKRQYLLKFNIGDEKLFLVNNIGTTIHLSQYRSITDDIPSAFCLRLRRYLRGRMLQNIRQIGVDRTIDIQFGKEDRAVHLILEYYAAGNLLLCDASYRIIMVQRFTKSEVARSQGMDAQPGTFYPVSKSQDAQRLCKVPLIRNGTINLSNVISSEIDSCHQSIQDHYNYITNNGTKCVTIMDMLSYLCPFSDNTTSGTCISVANAIVSNEKRIGDIMKIWAENIDQIRSIMSERSHNLSSEKSSTNTQSFPVLPKWMTPQSNIYTKLYNGPDDNTTTLLLIIASCLVCGIMAMASYPGAMGYELQNYCPIELSKVVCSFGVVDLNKRVADENLRKLITDSIGLTNEDSGVSGYSATDFGVVLTNFRISKLKEKSVLYVSIENKINSFADWCIVGDLHLEEARMGKKKKKKSKLNPVEKVQLAQGERIGQLQAEKEECLLRAHAIYSNEILVDHCINMIRALIATGVTPEVLWEHIKSHRKMGHPLCVYINKISLLDNEIELLLPLKDDDSNEEPEPDKELTHEDDDEEDTGEDAGTDRVVVTPIDVTIGVKKNVEKWFTENKALDVKMSKTEVALKSAIKKITKKEERKAHAKPLNATKSLGSIRNTYWFEKFFWFISSEGYVCVAGRDHSQNEYLYRRHLKPNDLYVHADIHGAATVIIKNYEGTTDEIPLQTILEAAQFAICRSVAWTNKVVIGAYWVYPDQVSKTAPTGQSLSSGSFVIRGKKNYLPPSRLEMGFGILYRVESPDKHMNDRTVDVEEAEELAKALEQKYGLDEFKMEENPVLKEIMEKAEQKEEKKRNMKELQKQRNKEEEDQLNREKKNTSSPDNSPNAGGKKSKRAKKKNAKKDDSWDSDNQLETAIELENKSKIEPVKFADNDGNVLRGRDKIKARKKAQWLETNARDEQRKNDAEVEGTSGGNLKAVNDILVEDTELPLKPWEKQGETTDANDEESDELDDEAMKNSRDYINCLTGIPIIMSNDGEEEGDTLIYAIPMVGPLLSFTTKKKLFKHYCRLYPGNANTCKKSKEVQNIVYHLLQKCEHEIEKTLIKRISIDEAVRSLIGGFRVQYN